MIAIGVSANIGNVHDAGDALIVGAGLAGLFAALKFRGRPVTILSPEPLGQGASSAWAQGGVAAAVGAGDSPDFHAADTIRAGAGIVDEAVVRKIVGEAEQRIDDLAKLGAPFDRDESGEYALSREAAHDRARVVRVAGDRAGREIMSVLVAAVEAAPWIEVLEGVIVVDVMIAEGRACGVLCRLVGDRYSSPLFLRSNAVLLAAGGLGGLYGVTTNPARVRGQAIGMAARAGAVVADAEFVQFHPTAINIGQDPAPLATEALRGEGALLINDSGHRFMLDVHPDAELASRDIVARAIFREIKAGRGAYLDTRQALGKRILSLFPTVAETCLAADIDPVTSPIPVAPAAHYHMGGVKADLNGRTSLEGLWAAGEAASTGLHGANRLASNGLLEALVIASRATADINDSTAVRQRKINRIVLNEKTNIDWTEEQELRRSSAVEELRAVMSQHCGVERSAEGLHSALRQIAALERNADHVSRSFLNMTTAATLVAAAALKREESRGGHFRTDFPETHAMAARSFITLAEAHSIRENAEKAKPNE